MINIKVCSEEVIKPSYRTPSHLHKLQFSLFDHTNTPVLMPLVFFFSPKHTPSTSLVLHQLRSSLPATLTVFYPLAGRFLDVNYIACNDEGVPYVQAHAPSTCLADVVHKADISDLDKLLPPHGNVEGYTKLLLAIQVSTFACGGVAIGIKMSHAVSDAFSLAMFLKNWANLANCDSLSPRPYFDIWKLFPPYQSMNSTNNIDSLVESNPELIEKRPLTKWFLFSEADCDALRSRLGSGDRKNTKASITIILSSFIWNRIKIACRGDNGINKRIPHEVFHAVNIRPGVKTIVDDKLFYYFGNMVVNALATPTRHNFLPLMKDSVSKIMGNCGSFIKALQEGREDLKFMMEHFERASRGEIVSLGFSSLRSLPVYQADFGWGKPVWVTSATLAYTDLVILIPAGPSSKDTFAFVNLTCDEMAKLVADQEFMSSVSKSASFPSISKL